MEFKIETPKKPVNSIKFFDETGLTIFIRENEWFIGGDCTEAQAKAALDAHNGTMPEPTIVQKLASVGLSLEELKAALS